MFYTRDDIIRKLSEKSGYYLKDIHTVLKAYDDLLVELMDDVTTDEDVIIQAFRGCKIRGYICKPHIKRDPKTQECIMIDPTVCLSSKFSDGMKQTVRERYKQRLEDSK